MRDLEVTQCEAVLHNINDRKDGDGGEHNVQLHETHVAESILAGENGPYENSALENGLQESPMHAEGGVFEIRILEGVSKEDGVNDRKTPGDGVLLVCQPIEIANDKDMKYATVTVVDEPAGTISEECTSEVVPKTSKDVITAKTKKKKKIVSKSTSPEKASVKPSNPSKISSTSNLKSVPAVLKRPPIKSAFTSVSSTSKTSVSKATDSKNTSIKLATPRPTSKPASSDPLRKPKVIPPSSKSLSTNRPVKQTKPVPTAKMVSVSSTSTSKSLGSGVTAKPNPAKKSLKSTRTEDKVSPSKSNYLKTTMAASCKLNTSRASSTQASTVNKRCACRFTGEITAAKNVPTRPALKNKVLGPNIDVTTSKLQTEKKYSSSPSNVARKSVDQLRVKVNGKTDARLSTTTETKKTTRKTTETGKVCNVTKISDVTYGMQKRKPPIASRKSEPCLLKSASKGSADKGPTKMVSTDASKSKGKLSTKTVSKSASSLITSKKVQQTKRDVPDIKAGTRARSNRPLVNDKNPKNDDDNRTPDLIINLTIEDDTPYSTQSDSTPLFSGQADETNMDDKSPAKGVESILQREAPVIILPDVEVMPDKSQGTNYQKLLHDDIKCQTIADGSENCLSPGNSTAKDSFESTASDIIVCNNSSKTYNTIERQGIDVVNEKLANLTFVVEGNGVFDRPSDNQSLGLVDHANIGSNKYELASVSSEKLDCNLTANRFDLENGGDTHDIKQVNGETEDNAFQAVAAMSQSRGVHSFQMPCEPIEEIEMNLQQEKLSKGDLCKNEVGKDAREGSEQFLWKRENDLTIDYKPESALHQNENEDGIDKTSRTSAKFQQMPCGNQISLSVNEGLRQSLNRDKNAATANEASHQHLDRERIGEIKNEITGISYNRKYGAGAGGISGHGHEVPNNKNTSDQRLERIVEDDLGVTVDDTISKSLQIAEGKETVDETTQLLSFQNKEELTTDEASEQFVFKDTVEMSGDEAKEQSYDCGDGVITDEIIQQFYDCDGEVTADEILQQYDCKDETTKDEIFQQTFVCEDDVTTDELRRQSYVCEDDATIDEIFQQTYGCEDKMTTDELFRQFDVCEGKMTTDESLDTTGTEVTVDEISQQPSCVIEHKMTTNDKTEDQTNVSHHSERICYEESNIDLQISDQLPYESNNGNDCQQMTEASNQEMHHAYSPLSNIGEARFDDENREVVPGSSDCDASQTMEENSLYIELLQSGELEEISDASLEDEEDDEGVCKNELENEVAGHSGESANNGSTCNRISDNYREQDANEFYLHEQQNDEEKKDLNESETVEINNKNQHDIESGHSEFVQKSEEIHFPPTMQQNNDGVDTHGVVINDGERLEPKRGVGSSFW